MFYQEAYFIFTFINTTCDYFLYICSQERYNNMKAKVLWLLLVNVTLATAQVQVIPAQLYQKIVERGYETQEVVTRLANYYYSNHNEIQALKYYQNLMRGIGYQLEPIEHYRYAVLLQKTNKKNEAKKQMNIFDDKMQLLFTKHPNTTPNDLMGLVTDAEKGTVVEGAQILLINAAGETLTDTTDINGFFVFSVNKIYPNFQEAYIEIQKTNYELMSQPIVLTTAQQKVYSLYPNVFQINKGDNLANIFNIDNIYFDFGHTNIRKDASVQLAKIVAFLEDNPTLKIIVKVHTDSRGDDKYNRELTEVQAKSIEQWLIKRGIASHRIIAKGYGATQLVNGCEKGVPCTEEEHQANKRVEFIVD